MDEQKFLAEQFDANRNHLRAVAYRMLGSLSEAEDAVQEAWLKLARADTSEVQNLAGWLTTVVARVCLDALRTRKAMREESFDDQVSEPPMSRANEISPEQELLMAESVGVALLVVLQTLAPAERIAFVMHDIFDFSFDEISPIVSRSPVATRQLASRARKRVRGTKTFNSDLADQRSVFDAFLAASRSGDFEALLSLLDPDVVFSADEAAMQAGAMTGDVRGASAIAKLFQGRAQGARSAIINGAVGAIVAPRGKLFLTLEFAIRDGKITEIKATADRERLSRIELAVPDA